MHKHSVALFASGSGTNAENIIRYFRASEQVSVDLLVCNRPDAPVIGKAKALGVEVLVSDNSSFLEGVEITARLLEKGVEWIVLAGFLRKIPDVLISAYADRIVNIHPALLPKFGGQGMYGRFVHEAVVNAGETESGISIHFVNGEFDSGEILAQHRVEIGPEDSAEDVARKVQELEHMHFPAEIERIITQND
jgi:phosphoribosylglycinamide formyltransferase 1